MNTIEPRHYYLLECAGQRLCLPAAEVRFMASVEDVGETAGIAGLAYEGALYPVYSLQDGLLPAMGVQAQDRNCLVLQSTGDESPMGIALSCSSVVKLRSESTLQMLPSFMLPPYALVIGLLKHENQWLPVISVDRIINFFEKVGYCDEQHSNAERLAG